MNKNHLWHVALLGIGAVILVIYLMRRSAAAPVAPAAAASAAAPSYPNAQPIQLGDITIGGSPLNLTYNTQPGGSLISDVAVGDASGCDGSPGCECAQVQTLTSINRIPAPILAASQKNYASLVSKAPLAMFGSAPIRPADPDGGSLLV